MNNIKIPKTSFFLIRLLSEVKTENKNKTAFGKGLPKPNPRQSYIL